MFADRPALPRGACAREDASVGVEHRERLETGDASQPLELAGDRAAQRRLLLARRCVSRFSEICIESSLERRRFRKCPDQSVLIELVTRLELGEDAGAHVQLRSLGPAHPIAGVDDEHDEDDEQDDRHRREDDGHRPRDEPWGLLHCAGTGRTKLASVTPPASTRTGTGESPRRSCHAVILRSPGGTPVSSKRPSSPTMANQGWLNTMIVAVMCEWMSQKTLMMPGLLT